jgi:hypothetical protein
MNIGEIFSGFLQRRFLALLFFFIGSDFIKITIDPSPKDYTEFQELACKPGESMEVALLRLFQMELSAKKLLRDLRDKLHQEQSKYDN